MINYIGKKVLVTTSAWFYGDDGKQYRSVHGTLKAVHEVSKSIGFTPSRTHANWTFEIGNMIIMGCQVMYILQCDVVNTEPVKDWRSADNEVDSAIEFIRPCAIYITE